MYNSKFFAMKFLQKPNNISANGALDLYKTDILIG